MTQRELKRVINNAIKDYSNPPNISYGGYSDGCITVFINGGHWAARQDIEDALIKHNVISEVTYRDTKKTIRTTVPDEEL